MLLGGGRAPWWEAAGAWRGRRIGTRLERVKGEKGLAAVEGEKWVGMVRQVLFSEGVAVL